jgi:hypothetical protein
MLIQGEAENALQAQLARYALYPLGNSNRWDLEDLPPFLAHVLQFLSHSFPAKTL